MSKFCGIPGYLHVHHSKLFTLLDSKCLMWLVRTRNGQKTFLVPPLSKLSSKRDVLERQIKAHVLVGCFKSMNDFKDDEKVKSMSGTTYTVQKKKDSVELILSDGSTFKLSEAKPKMDQVSFPSENDKKMTKKKGVHVFLINNVIGGKRGGSVSGGSDNGAYMNNIFEKSESVNRQNLLKIAVGYSITDCKTDNHPNTMVHSMVSLLHFLSENCSDSWWPIVCYLSNPSPLMYYHIIYLLPDSILQEWVSTKREYDNVTVYEKCLEKYNKNCSSDISNYKKVNISSINVNNILDKIDECHRHLFKDEILPSDVKKAMGVVQKSKDDLIAWQKSMNEFCYLYSSEFVSCCMNNDPSAIEDIHNKFKGYYQSGLISNKPSVRLQSSAALENGGNLKVMAITLYAYYVSCVCAGTGYTPGNEYKIIPDNNPLLPGLKDTMNGVYEFCRLSLSK